MKDYKTIVEIIKFKLTIFSTILGAGIYLFLNKKHFIQIFDDLLFYLILAMLMIYGVLGFLYNLLKLNTIEQQLEKGRE